MTVSVADSAPCARRREGHRMPLFGPLLVRLYGRTGERIRRVLRWLIARGEGGELHSLSLREVFSRFHGVEIGLYTAGAPFVPRAFPVGTRVGRFCSIFWTVRAFNANHPMNLKSTHALFYNPALGLVTDDLITRPPLEIGADVFIGHNAIILPSVRKIGTGAVIGAGAVVHEDVQPYAVVVPHPSRVVRHRFDKATIDELLASQWWDRKLEELRPGLAGFRRPLNGGAVR